MSTLPADTITVSANLSRGVNLTYSQTSTPYGINNPSFTSSGRTTVNYASGGGEKAINKSANLTITLAPNTQETFTLTTGNLTGGVTGTLTEPDGSVCTFAGINILDINCQASAGSGNTSFTVAGGSVSPWFGPTGNSTTPLTFSGSDSNGLGGGFSFDRSDSIGYPVTAANNNLVIGIPSGSASATLTINLSGQ
jgi:hypothetical protein